MELGVVAVTYLLLVAAVIFLLQRPHARVRGAVRVMRGTEEVVQAQRLWWPDVPAPVPLTMSRQDIQNM